ncbi:XTP/dITP diphosphatase [Evansella sp. AB-P1]|uniref:XTP/dITP diphosphatase n=1 Tax=Evansella sp. AB-P1 TaxID=3037653 RepID=UPI00241E149F|nr:XTP/dITP diphosphatase [Evansella sp. AB-P1]MDG5786902.1 XTP/dITP diphosphatase [Evansella sp. AB-P1]
MNEIFIATMNKGKVAEFEAFFIDQGITVKSLLDLEEEIEIIEDGKTFEENAIKKAEEIGKRINKPVIADDSGLEVDALGGKPGIYSARYAGTEKSDQANIYKLLNEMSSVPTDKRTARFVCALAVYIPGSKTKVVRGICEGIITEVEKGNKGFGYDPIFYLPELGKTMSQIDRSEKNKRSHRYDALKKLKNNWNEWM